MIITNDQRTALTKVTRVSLTLVGVVALSLGLSACAGGSAEGTYFGTSGDTALIINSDKTCQYTESYEADEDLESADMEDCTWTKSENSYTFVGLISSGTIVGTMTDDGALSLPTQDKWIGEIYTKG